MKRAAVIQSSYLPWKGYFHIVGSVDEFILLDDVPYSKGTWRNRNRIKTANGPKWLTIPVRVKGRLGQPIREVEIAEARWAKQHWHAIRTWYARAAHFDELAPALDELYREAADEPLLSRVNERFIRALAGWLGIATRITRSMDYRLESDRTERLVGLCADVGASTYLSGPAARVYLDESRFAARGMRVEWADYRGFPEYRQLYPPFVHEVTVLDLLLNEGCDRARRFLVRHTPLAPPDTAKTIPAVPNGAEVTAVYT